MSEDTESSTRAQMARSSHVIKSETPIDGSGMQKETPQIDAQISPPPILVCVIKLPMAGTSSQRLRVGWP